MSDLDTRIRAFVGELLDSAPIAPPFPAVDPKTRRRPGANRRRLVLAAIGVVALLATALVVVTGRHDSPRVQINTGPATPAHGGDALSFHEVLGTFPYQRQATPCRTGALGAPSTAPSGSAVLPDREKSACYVLGPTLLTGHNISTADAVVNSTTAAWTINLHFANDDFVTKVAVPYVNRQIAIVLNGVVESAPRIDPGITGQDVTISGVFDEATAKRVALSIAPPTVGASDTTDASDPQAALLETFSAQCAKVAPRLGFAPDRGASEIRTADARAGLARANEPVPASLAAIEASQELAMCEFTATRSGVTPTSVCANGATVDVGPLILYAVDAHLNATRLPDVKYLFPLPPGISANPPPDVCRLSSP